MRHSYRVLYSPLKSGTSPALEQFYALTKQGASSFKGKNVNWQCTVIQTHSSIDSARLLFQSRSFGASWKQNWWSNDLIVSLILSEMKIVYIYENV